MSIIHSLPPGNETLNPSITIVAAFDASTGSYKFSGEKIDLYELVPCNGYLLESITVGANITNEDYTTGKKGDTLLSLYFGEQQSNRAQFFPTPFNVTNVINPINTNTWFYSTNGDDVLQIMPVGEIVQQANMIDLEEIIFTIQAEIYRVDDQKFVERLKREM